MAISYGLIAEVAVEPRTAAELVVASTTPPPGRVTPNPRTGSWEATTASGMWVVSYDARPDLDNRWDCEAYASDEVELGFSPLLRVVFRLDKFADFRVQMDDVARAVAAVLRQGDGDAAVLFEGEVPWLRRVEGVVLLSDEEAWPLERQALLPEPRRVVDLEGGV